MRRAARTDNTHASMARELQQVGFCVVHTHTLGSGFPDLLISRNGVWALVEAKTPKGRKTALERRSADQIEWHSKAKGPIITAYSAVEVLYEFKLLLKRREAWAL